jgi:hypothetical protein
MPITDRVPNVKLTVIVRDESPVRYVNEPPTYRTVHIGLTDEQLRLLTLAENEAIQTAFLEEPR